MNVVPYEEIQKMGRSKCVLLVDDEEVILDVGTMMLEKIGYQVLGARNSAEAVEIFKQSGNEIDLVLLDLKLPDESGAETFKKIRAIDPDARVILSTGYNETQEVFELMDLGCRGMLQKPFSLERLFEKVAEALS
jgi:two-component system cell cycle sensor histidine kinase/response regulator CckA